MNRKDNRLAACGLAFLFALVSGTAAYGGAGGSGAPWFPDEQYFGKTQYDGTLYVLFQDTGKKSIPGGVGSQGVGDFSEYVVEIQFILELQPAKGKAAPVYFSGIGKTCEDSYGGDPFAFPVCSGEDSYNDWFYLPGDYVSRIGAALHSFLQETVYPALCDGDAGCAFLAEAQFTDGTGNAGDVVGVDPNVPTPPHPWFWVQPITIVTP